jgi:hypothetical protein
MDNAILDRLRLAHRKFPDAIFSVFTTAGHVISGRLVTLDNTVVLEAGRETAEVPGERVEAFSYRRP